MPSRATDWSTDGSANGGDVNGSGLVDIEDLTQVILAWGDPAPGRHWQLEVDANRRLRFACGAGFALASRLVGDTQWHHIAVALDALDPARPHVGDLRLYVDAQPQTVYELNEQDLGACTTESLRIGVLDDPTAGTPFNGVLDDLALYDTALSPADIRQVYREAAPQ